MFESSTRLSFISSQDNDFIGTTVAKMATELEESTIQKKDYQSLVSSINHTLTSVVDPSELINEIVKKENMCAEVINMAGKREFETTYRLLIR